MIQADVQTVRGQWLHLALHELLGCESGLVSAMNTLKLFIGEKPEFLTMYEFLLHVC